MIMCQSFASGITQRRSPGKPENILLNWESRAVFKAGIQAPGAAMLYQFNTRTETSSIFKD
jgi:hypothetical protein